MPHIALQLGSRTLAFAVSGENVHKTETEMAGHVWGSRGTHLDGKCHPTDLLLLSVWPLLRMW